MNIKRIILSIFLGLLSIAPVTYASGLNYGAGEYGACTYGTCGITISSSGTVNLGVTPQTGQTICTVDKDDVSVTTGATVGYTMTLSSTSSNVTLAGATYAGTINAVGSSYGSPAALTANTWGYRIDSTGSFGSGPTSTMNNVTIPSETFAPMPALASPQTIRTTAAAATPSNTSIWYGTCATMALPADTYSRSVVYTAMTN